MDEIIRRVSEKPSEENMKRALVFAVAEKMKNEANADVAFLKQRLCWLCQQGPSEPCRDDCEMHALVDRVSCSCFLYGRFALSSEICKRANERSAEN